MKAVVLLLLGFFTGIVGVFAQQSEKKRDRELLGANSEGTHYFVGFMENELYECTYYYGERSISIASRFNTRFTITYPNGTVIEGALNAMQLRSYLVDRRYECVGEGVFNNGIEIKSEYPISVYCYSSRPQTSDGYLALPVTAWGTQYVTANHGVDYYDPEENTDTICSIYPRGGEFAIIAAEDNTSVTVYPKTRTYDQVGMVTKVLMKGQIYQLQDGGFVRGGSDLTGSVVTSDKPVGLLSGHVRTGIPVGYPTKDHIIEMIPPRNELGKTYMAVPFGGRLGGDLVRIISTDASPTTLTISTDEGTSTQVVSGLGEFAEFILTKVTVIKSDKPVLVTQYSRSTDVDPRNDTLRTIHFDPDMIVVTPEEQYVNGAVFQTRPNQRPGSHPLDPPQFEVHYMTVVAEESKFETMRLNGKPLPDNEEFHGGKVEGTPYVWASMKVAEGSIHVLTGDALFGGYVYGLGSVDSYAWPIGTRLQKFDIPDSNRPVLNAERDCGGFNVTARESGPFESGLRNAWIDSTFSQNVDFERVMLIIGDEFSLGYVSLKDPSQSGRARFIAEDLASNRDTIEIELAAPPILTFGSEKVELPDVQVSTDYQKYLAIHNRNSEPMVIDHITLVTRKFFLPNPSLYEGRVIPPADSLMVDIRFRTEQRLDAHDTILVKSQCLSYRVPLHASIGVPRIGTNDLDFDSLRVGRERTMDLHVSNPGTAVLHIDRTEIAGAGFTMAALLQKPDSLLPGADTVLQVRFVPDRIGEFTGTVSFYSDADTVALAHLRGVGIYPAVSIGGYDFGLIAAGDTSCTLVPVVNTGDDTLHLTDIMLSEEKEFIVDRKELPRDLGPGDTLWVRVCFVPTEEGVYTSDAFPQNSDGVEGTGRLQGRSFLLRATLSGYDWKERWVNTEHDSVVFLRNLSTQPISIDSVYIDESAGDPGDFKIIEVQPLPRVVAAGEMLPIKVRFTPLLPGLRSSIIRGIGGIPGGPGLMVDSVLQGFGIIALASDETDFDSSLIFSCASRRGSVTIMNDGNTPLTLVGMQVESSVPGLVRLIDTPAAQHKIPVGESLRIEFEVDPAGYVGPITSTISWSFMERSFMEPPDTLRRTFTITSAPQEYHISALTPKNVALGKPFDLHVRVDSAFWRQLPQGDVELRIEHNPLVARFDASAWSQRAGTTMGRWRPAGAPVFEAPGVVMLRFQPAVGDSAALDTMTFLALPFESFLGNNSRDTFQVTMTVPGGGCVLASLADAPYMLDSLCGLENRLFEFTGDAYTLKQNRPNPTGTATEIEFTLGMEAHTTLELFASDGRTVRMLVNAPLAAGQHLVPVDLSELPSGLYYYRLTSGPFNAVRQMMVAK